MVKTFAEVHIGCETIIFVYKGNLTTKRMLYNHEDGSSCLYLAKNGTFIKNPPQSNFNTYRYAISVLKNRFPKARKTDSCPIDNRLRSRNTIQYFSLD